MSAGTTRVHLGATRRSSRMAGLHQPSHEVSPIRYTAPRPIGRMIPLTMFPDVSDTVS